MIKTHETNKNLHDLLDEFKEIVVENANLYLKICKLIKQKNTSEISQDVLTSIEETNEEIARTNINLRLLKLAISNNSEVARIDKNMDNMKELLPALFLLFSMS